MFNVREIIRNNNATFYDFNTQKRKSQVPRFVCICLIALTVAVVCPSVSDSLLSSVLAVQSILLGFTVNVMFFLLGNREKETGAVQSIEAKLRSKRLQDLYHELFYNVSYFNLISVASIIVATGLLLPTPEVPGFMRGFPPVDAYVSWLQTSSIPTVAGAIVRLGSMSVFYAISIEVIFSIARVIGRTSFYFERKLGEMPRPADGE